MQHPTRREIMMGGAVLTVAAGTARSEAKASANTTTDKATVETAVGTVSEVSKDPIGSRLPLQGVLVSNGRDVVRTDSQGRFSLPIAPGQSVFVIKPSGFEVPVDPTTNLPRFSYVHDPGGTPARLKLRYGGLPPTGPLPASVDFQLKRAPEPKAFDVLLFTDPQPETTTEVAFVRDSVVSGLIGSNAAFGMTCGDIAFDDLSQFGRINSVIGRIGIPWWNIGGNHDLDLDAPNAARSRDTFKRVYGAPYYAHEYGDALFVMLDNVDYLGAALRDSGVKQAYRGYFSPDQLRFVENLLAATSKEKLVVFAMHIPLKTHLGDDGVHSAVNTREFLKVIGDRRAVSFSGHTHSTEHHYLGPEDGFFGAESHHHHVLTAVSGSWWSGPRDHHGIASADSYDGSPNGHHVLSIDGANYETRFVPAAERGRQMRISLQTGNTNIGRSAARDLPLVELLRSPISVAQAAETQVTVNVFDGGPKTKVSLAIDGAAAVEMAQVKQPDPLIVQLYQRHRETFKKWVVPQDCSHLWSAPLPVGLKEGAYALTVTATDEYGRRHVDRMVLEVVSIGEHPTRSSGLL